MEATDSTGASVLPEFFQKALQHDTTHLHYKRSSFFFILAKGRKGYAFYLF